MGKLKPEGIFKLETVICKAAGITLDELIGRERSPRYVRARHAVWYLANEYMEYSYSQLGAYYDRDHTTVAYGCQKMRGDDAARIALVDGIRKNNPELLKKKEHIPDWRWD